MTNGDSNFYEFGPFRVDPADRRLLREGEPVALRPKVFDILVALLERRGRLVGKDELLSAVWPGQFVEEGNLNKSISTLRQALGESPSSHQYIETVPKHGYRFVADVRELKGGGALREASPVRVEAAVPETAPAGTRPEGPVARGDRAREVRPRRRWPVILAGLLLTTVTAALIVRGRPSPAQPAVTSIAVLPLENLSGDPSQEYFADGITDALIADLARIGELRVISRTSSMHYKGANKPLPQIAGELKVDAVVEGTVQRAGDRVRVRAQLIHAATDRHLWAETYERDVRDVLALQSEIARTIARQVQIKTTAIGAARIPTGKPVSPKALDEYLKGRHVYWNVRTDEDLRKAMAHYERAVEHEPGYALAHLALADAHNALGLVLFGALPPMEARRKAEQAAARALELDPSLGEAHATLGEVRYFNWRWEEAEDLLRRALELSPSSSRAHGTYAGYLVARGRFDDGIAASNRALELDPLSLAVATQRGFLLENARRYDEAIEQLRSVIALNPQTYRAHWFLGHTFVAAGRYEEGVAAAEKAVELSGRAPGALGMLGLAYGKAGRKEDARKILDELSELRGRRYVTPAAFWNVYVGLGDTEQAFAWLEEAYREGSPSIAWLKVFPILDPLRPDPRFADLLRRVGLAP
jgi:TolB-like protein/DNA-binding winged helix-turn-helix (wHTH) protein/Flp pilus assembly protein TadD